MTDLPLEARGEARRVKLLLRQIDTLPGIRLLQQLRALIKALPKTPQHRQDLAHALRNAATRINALANELDNARDAGDAA
jgi:hypothetical protein